MILITIALRARASVRAHTCAHPPARNRTQSLTRARATSRAVRAGAGGAGTPARQRDAAEVGGVERLQACKRLSVR